MKLKTGLLALVLAGGFLSIVGYSIYNIRLTQHKEQLAARERESIGKSMPEFSLPVLQQPGKNTPQRIGKAELLGRHYILHGWASWCAGCRAEQPVIREFTQRYGIRMIGYNVNDEREAALRWLARYGDPYEFSMVQASEDAPGVIPLTTTPQLLLIDREGVVRWRSIGEVDMKTLEEKLLPELKAMERGT